jgi:hypothetical protein
MEFDSFVIDEILVPRPKDLGQQNHGAVENNIGVDKPRRFTFEIFDAKDRLADTVEQKRPRV